LSIRGPCQHDLQNWYHAGHNTVVPANEVHLYLYLNVSAGEFSLLVCCARRHASFGETFRAICSTPGLCQRLGRKKLPNFSPKLLSIRKIFCTFHYAVIFAPRICRSGGRTTRSHPRLLPTSPTSDLCDRQQTLRRRRQGVLWSFCREWEHSATK
jgi:hypothetical protein